MEFLNDKEKRVLSALFTLGSTSVSQLAKETMLNRTSLYPVLQKLLDRGLVSKVALEGSVAYEPLSVHEVSEWAERQKREAAQAADDFAAWAEQAAHGNQPSLVSDIKHFEGFEGVKSLYADTWRNNPEKIIYAITDYEQAYATLGDFFTRQYFPKRTQKGVQVKNLLPPSTAGKRDLKTQKDFLRDMRFVNLFEDLGIELNIYHDRLALVAFDATRPSGVLIKNETIARAFKNIFEYLWKAAGTVEVKKAKRL